jgi:hypothetical protein
LVVSQLPERGLSLPCTAGQPGLTRHCGLDWDECCLAFHKTSRTVQTASTIQVRKPLSTKSMGWWKHYRDHLKPPLKALQAP